jgi:hypothetical protein
VGLFCYFAFKPASSHDITTPCTAMRLFLEELSIASCGFDILINRDDERLDALVSGRCLIIPILAIT